MFLDFATQLPFWNPNDVLSTNSVPKPIFRWKVKLNKFVCNVSIAEWLKKYCRTVILFFAIFQPAGAVGNMAKRGGGFNRTPILPTVVGQLSPDMKEECEVNKRQPECQVHCSCQAPHHPDTALSVLAKNQNSDTKSREQQQVWSLTQLYSVDFSQSRIGAKKCVLFLQTHSQSGCTARDRDKAVAWRNRRN